MCFIVGIAFVFCAPSELDWWRSFQKLMSFAIAALAVRLLTKQGHNHGWFAVVCWYPVSQPVLLFRATGALRFLCLAVCNPDSKFTWTYTTDANILNVNGADSALVDNGCRPGTFASPANPSTWTQTTQVLPTK
jgi:hypothetical protein